MSKKKSEVPAGTRKKQFLERSVDVSSGSGEERQELDRLCREKERLAHQIEEICRNPGKSYLPLRIR